VQPGDCLAKIASDFGFSDYRRIYDHPANVEFKRRRPNPFVIKAGDNLVIPGKPLAKVHECETGKEHTFVVGRPETWLAIYVRHARKPLANKGYILTVGNVPIEGRTDEAGLVSQSVPAWATRAELHFPDNDISFNVKIGDLDPLAEVSGLRQRLENLGFASDDWSGFALDDHDGKIGSATTEALRRFQMENHLEPTGEINEETTARLHELHDRKVAT
jgi:N-acetylmuramoyl-L-alanine amidase